MSTLMIVLLYMHSNEAQLWNHSTSVLRISVSERNRTLELISSNPLTSDKKAEALRKQLLGVRSVIRVPPTALSTPQQLPMSSFKVVI